MCGGVSFDDVKAFFKTQQYEYMGFYRKRVVFDRPHDPNATAFAVVVNHGEVCKAEFARIQAFFA